ncbi:MAG: hypothetical protein ABSB23_13630 [Bryobacteraceae bacterium]|jgi:hypothetical protein
MSARIVAMLMAASIGLAVPGASVPSIVQRSVEANTRDWQAAPGYNYFDRERTGNGTRSYQVLMILGSPYRRLVAINGKTLPPAEQAEEQRKLDETVGRRRNESPKERAERMASYRRDRRRDRQLMNQLVQAFNFRLLGEQRLGPRTVYVLQATPRPGYTPPSLETRVLTGMQGKLWIDTETFQWVKVEASVIHPVWIEGFLARVDPGTRFELEYGPVSGDVWLPKHFAMKSRARILFVFRHRGQADQTYFGYEKAGTTISNGSHPVSNRPMVLDNQGNNNARFIRALSACPTFKAASRDSLNVR